MLIQWKNDRWISAFQEDIYSQFKVLQFITQILKIFASTNKSMILIDLIMFKFLPMIDKIVC